MRIYLHHSLPPYPGTTIARVGLPSCVTPLLNYYHTTPERSILSTKAEILSGTKVLVGSLWAILSGYGNINPLSIDYA